MERTSVPRRTVLHSIGSLALAGIATAAGSGVAGAESAPDRETRRSACDRRSGPCERPPVPPSVANRPDTYAATVDRVVDGAHVVILLEEGGRVVDQLVVPAEDYPCLEERDGLVVRLGDDGPAWIRRRREPESLSSNGSLGANRRSERRTAVLGPEVVRL